MAAFTDTGARMRWFFQADTWTTPSLFAPAAAAPGARESCGFSPPLLDTPVVTNETTWLDVIDVAWLVFACAMTIGADPLSSSPSTVRFAAKGRGTRRTFTEQGVYHARYAERQAGGAEGKLDRLGPELDRARGQGSRRFRSSAPFDAAHGA